MNPILFQDFIEPFVLFREIPHTMCVSSSNTVS